MAIITKGEIDKFLILGNTEEKKILYLINMTTTILNYIEEFCGEIQNHKFRPSALKYNLTGNW